MSSQQQAQFRDVFRGHPAGVTLISATVDGRPVGLTASSVSSLSLDPLSVSFSFMKDTGSAGELLRADSVLIHFLTQDQADVAATFAAPSGGGAVASTMKTEKTTTQTTTKSEDPHTDATVSDRFAAAHGWTTSPTGEPLLPGCRAVMRARYISTMPAGHSTLVAAEVLDVLEQDPETEPLLFMGHKFYGTKPLAPVLDS
ncbi:flavin oxidoreductase [Corynebacterium falsenii DSM 44353]|uniref:flavin reductase family protein n=1 Tax=Corynebacterium falsenii TaxID=108486 RepID=UPI0003E95DA8|nr:flavin reductase family protein [Corynebacterium falsenii]AHI02716.1 flavin oxidoreductase [Corynebacterium falsenii DSM 44353]UBI05501.1 flavin reductase family protein [Corynebacterium falsenii]